MHIFSVKTEHLSVATFSKKKSDLGRRATALCLDYFTLAQV